MTSPQPDDTARGFRRQPPKRDPDLFRANVLAQLDLERARRRPDEAIERRLERLEAAIYELATRHAGCDRCAS